MTETYITPAVDEIVLIHIDPTTHDVLDEGDTIAVRPRAVRDDDYAEE